MLLQLFCDLRKLPVYFGIGLIQLVDGLRGADTGNNVLALGVHEVLTVKLLLARCGIAREGNTRTGIIAHVSEYHFLDIDRCSPVAGNVVQAAVNNGAGIVP